MIFSSGKKTLSWFVSLSSRAGGPAFSRRGLLGVLHGSSFTRRLKTGARSRRSRVHSVNSTSHETRRLDPGDARARRRRPGRGEPRSGEVSRRSGSSVSQQLADVLVGEAAAAVAGVLEVVGREQQRAEAGARALAARVARDQQLDLVAQLDLAPVVAAAARPVARPDRSRAAAGWRSCPPWRQPGSRCRRCGRAGLRDPASTRRCAPSYRSGCSRAAASCPARCPRPGPMTTVSPTLIRAGARM